jgi:hypothetical protein
MFAVRKIFAFFLFCPSSIFPISSPLAKLHTVDNINNDRNFQLHHP